MLALWNGYVPTGKRDDGVGTVYRPRYQHNNSRIFISSRMTDRYMVLVGRTDSLKDMLENKVTKEQREFMLGTMQLDADAIDNMSFEDAQKAISENIEIRRKYVGVDMVMGRLDAIHKQRSAIHAKFKKEEVTV